jgi:GMP synthase (glutamine-hydrolysing)
MICLVDCGSLVFINLVQMLKDLETPFKVVELDDANGENLQEFTGIIISGSSKYYFSKQAEILKPKFAFLKGISIPTLGICFGHQAEGFVNGSKVSNIPKVEGMKKIRILKQDPLFSGLPEDPVFFQSHEDLISLPEGFVHLADSFNCLNEAMKHETKPIYGTQFHPEVSGENGKTVLKNFCEICKGK